MLQLYNSCHRLPMVRIWESAKSSAKRPSSNSQVAMHSGISTFCTRPVSLRLVKSKPWSSDAEGVGTTQHTHSVTSTWSVHVTGPNKSCDENSIRCNRLPTLKILALSGLNILIWINNMNSHDRRLEITGGYLWTIAAMDWRRTNDFTSFFLGKLYTHGRRKKKEGEEGSRRGSTPT